ncbi:chitinase [Stackebrandtia nassauensis]|uniref:chitinase n=1 Tax=Stackebrandtia nassauensis (strain DSM 44728 / CIP 108903 / NRRL B-16338 / NBRC 102104 / LLR-40K-21) TaxID=446470 RepID=D3Q7U2_STANL|nr:chitinase [Stackebrandtia nassauensis]ADD40447.1 glycoside hydrolase family 18 [Stackebrandtia nassauensis DSM 44728]
MSVTGKRYWRVAAVAAIALAASTGIALTSHADDTSTKDSSTAELPKHTLTGYWHNFDNGSTVKRLSDVPAEYNIVAAAFAEADASKPGAVTFGVSPEVSDALGGYSDDDFKADVKALQDKGQHVILSVGGEKGNVVVDDATKAANFASSVKSLMDEYGFNGVDIDLEHGINAQHMGAALKDLSSQAGDGLTITMAPQTIDMQSTSTEYFKLALDIKDILTVVNMQYYNSGSMNGCDGQVYAQGTVEFLTSLACIQLENGLSPSQVGLGLPATSQAAGGGHVDPAVVNAALDCLAKGENCGSHKPPKTYPDIRGAMTWSINWDATSDYAFAKTVGGHLSEMP